ncbi:MAG: sortase [Candidatus Curtissbacteria bacterium]|nr:sortase [Candidatus Curtissbacteria bacterium]
MSLAVYIKEDTALKRILKRKRNRAFALIISAFGLFAIVFAVWPYLAWQFVTLPKLTKGVEHAPVPQSQVLADQSFLSENVQVAKDEDGFSYFTTNYVPTGEKPDEFSLTIPKLKISEAKVKVDSLKFYEQLSHFPGSALPGELGNSFITGHSVLPQFNDPENYRTIFTKLPELEVGDDVYVEIEGQHLHFVVQYAKVVDPHDVSVLAPISQRGHNLTLMTCVPPGTSIKRLVVITSLI